MKLISSYIEKLVGKDFEIECHTIELVKGRDDSPAIFRGPGVLKGGAYGPISFRMHNQSDLPKSVYELIDEMKADHDAYYRVIAIAYDDVEWIGAWCNPRFLLSEAAHRNQLIVSGDFDDLSARIRKYDTDPSKNLTELVFSESPNLPIGRKVFEKRERGRASDSDPLWDSEGWHQLEIDGSQFEFHENPNDELFHITVTRSDSFGPPCVENWIPEALTFVMGNRVYPRMVIRHFEKDCLVFIRNNPKLEPTGLEPPIPDRPHWNDIRWDIFASYLRMCASQDEFDHLPLTTIFTEVICASRATLQGFVLSLSVCIENLIDQLYDSLNIEPADKDAARTLRKHVREWEGDETVKGRAMGLLSMLGTRSINDACKTLVEKGVLREQHVKAWKNVRPTVTHGKLIEFPISQDLWSNRNLLVGMVYRLSYTIMGYKGKIADYGMGYEDLVDFPNK